MTEPRRDESREIARVYWIHALTPLHVGSGRGIGFIDLPIAREQVTNFPYVPGSAVKGVLADSHGVTVDSRKSDELHYRAFGRADDDGETSNSGSLVFTDAHLICLPVRSLYGTFAWCTSPIVLARLKRHVETTGRAALPGVPAIGDVAGLLVPNGVVSALVSTAERGAVYFDDLDFVGQEDETAAQWATKLAESVFPGDADWQGRFQKRFAVVHDDVFSFLAENATQVDARVQIDDDTKTVGEGPWYEESLPSETILAGIAWCGPVFGPGRRNDHTLRQQIVDKFCRDPAHVQLGGKATIGRGQVRVAFQTSP